MKTRRYWFVTALVVLAAGLGAVFYYQNIRQKPIRDTLKEIELKQEFGDSAQEQENNLPEKVLLNVPFTPQAPFAQWDNPSFADGCEEAASLMAMRWVRNQGLTLQEASDEILALDAFERQKYGQQFLDLSAASTSELIKEYYQHDKVRVKYDIGVNDILSELAAGHLVIVPADGTKLGNPYYRQPGPPRHMLVIRGYNQDRQEFVTNDPGTKRGLGYKYSYQTVINAVRDYPTGNKGPIMGVSKAMIVIERGY